MSNGKYICPDVRTCPFLGMDTKKCNHTKPHIKTKECDVLDKPSLNCNKCKECSGITFKGEPVEILRKENLLEILYYVQKHPLYCHNCRTEIGCPKCKGN